MDACVDSAGGRFPRGILVLAEIPIPLGALGALPGPPALEIALFEMLLRYP